ncbi:hypothetical protein BDZ89DRAFT_1049756 [Hymenopellis radicata]|nr:hypothetical protein BDZ89DRAFT_1049756 [Hymenopellis radicata]
MTKDLTVQEKVGKIDTRGCRDCIAYAREPQDERFGSACSRMHGAAAASSEPAPMLNGINRYAQRPLTDEDWRLMQSQVADRIGSPDELVACPISQCLVRGACVDMARLLICVGYECMSRSRLLPAMGRVREKQGDALNACKRQTKQRAVYEEPFLRHRQQRARVKARSHTSSRFASGLLGAGHCEFVWASKQEQGKRTPPTPWPPSTAQTCQTQTHHRSAAPSR